MIEYVTEIRAASNAPTPETFSFFFMVRGLGNRMSDSKDIPVRVKLFQFSNEFRAIRHSLLLHLHARDVIL